MVDIRFIGAASIFIQLMSDTPPPPVLQQGQSEINKPGLNKVHYVLLLASIILMALGAALDWSRVMKRTSDLAPSISLDSYRFGSVAGNVIIPGIIAVIVAAVSRRNSVRRLVLTLFWSCFVIALGHLGQLTMPPPSPRLLEPVTHIAGATLVTNDSPRFTIEIPEGFAPYDSISRPASVVHAYIGPVSHNSTSRAVILITRLGGLLPGNTEQNRKRLRDSMPSNVELTSKRWRGMDINTCIARVATNGVILRVYQMRIPLKPKAIEVDVQGLATDEQELSILANALLSSLDGPISW